MHIRSCHASWFENYHGTFLENRSTVDLIVRFLLTECPIAHFLFAVRFVFHSVIYPIPLPFWRGNLTLSNYSALSLRAEFTERGSLLDDWEIASAVELPRNDTVFGCG